MKEDKSKQVEATQKKKGLTFFEEMRRVKWSNLSNTTKTFIVTLFIIVIFSLLFFGFDALIGVIFGGIGVI